MNDYPRYLTSNQRLLYPVVKHLIDLNKTRHSSTLDLPHQATENPNSRSTILMYRDLPHELQEALGQFDGPWSHFAKLLVFRAGDSHLGLERLRVSCSTATAIVNWYSQCLRLWMVVELLDWTDGSDLEITLISTAHFRRMATPDRSFHTSM